MFIASVFEMLIYTCIKLFAPGQKGNAVMDKDAAGCCCHFHHDFDGVCNEHYHKICGKKTPAASGLIVCWSRRSRKWKELSNTMDFVVDYSYIQALLGNSTQDIYPYGLDNIRFMVCDDRNNASQLKGM